MSDDAEITHDIAEPAAIERDKRGRFLTGGRPGPGRKPGSRNRLTEDFLKAMADDFAEHGAEAIERTRIERPEIYVRICADLLPRQAQLDVEVDVGVNAGDFVSAFRNAVALLHGEAPERIPARPLKVINAKKS
jgi:hypothetical protein